MAMAGIQTRHPFTMTDRSVKQGLPSISGNQQYWEINNLRVRNWSDDNQDKGRSAKASVWKHTAAEHIITFIFRNWRDERYPRL